MGDIGRHWETGEDGGSLLLRVCRAFTDGQEKLGATGSNMKPTEAWQYAPQPLTLAFLLERKVAILPKFLGNVRNLSRKMHFSRSDLGWGGAEW